MIVTRLKRMRGGRQGRTVTAKTGPNGGAENMAESPTLERPEDGPPDAATPKAPTTAPTAHDPKPKATRGRVNPPPYDGNRFFA